MLNYSIHTYELYSTISSDTYVRIYQHFYDINSSIEKNILNLNSGMLHIFEFRHTPYYGINNVKIQQKILHNEIIKYSLHIIVNPYNAYYKLHHSDENIITSNIIINAIAAINEQLHLFLAPSEIENLVPYRIDFCVNLPFSTQAQAEEYINLMRIGIPPKCLKEVTHFDSKQHRHIPYKDALLLKCNSYSFEIYSKHIQIEKSRIPSAKTSAAGLVRIELRANRQKLTTISKQYKIDLLTHNYYKSFHDISPITKSLIHKLLGEMFGTGDFYQHADTINMISSAKAHTTSKEFMCNLVNYFSNTHAHTLSLDKYHITRTKWKFILAHFNSIGCSPITVPKSYSLKKYPGINSWDTYF